MGTVYFSSFDDANWTDKNILSDARLKKDLVEPMSSFRVGNEDYSADIMGDAYEYLIKKLSVLSMSPFVRTSRRLLSTGGALILFRMTAAIIGRR